MDSLLSKLPAPVKTPLSRLRRKIGDLRYHGKGRFCPICETSSSRFKPYGRRQRPEAQCVHCGSLERHRLVWLFLNQKTDLFNGQPKKMLHVAPETCIEPLLKNKLGANYLTADLLDPNVMEVMDICDIQYPDSSFDVIYCSHVLEHVADDKQAMREFYRVLKNTGWAILNVPIKGETTFEDPSIVDPQERLKAFGQEDHVRRYGTDYIDRLREAGFKVQPVNADSLGDKDNAVKTGISDVEDLFYCTR